jgi:hypothetical protein
MPRGYYNSTGLPYHPVTEFKKGNRTNSQFKKGGCFGKDNPAWKNSLTKLQQHELEAGRPRPQTCEICNATGKICFDHDHKTGKFRGWICENCNRALGHAKDNPEILYRMSEYLRKSFQSTSPENPIGED